MAVKYLHWLGLAACVMLIVSCFLPWVHYADLNENFTGFYSYKNEYGRPGKFLVLTAAIMIVFTLLPRVWAKRANLFIGAITVAYAVKSYILFSSCYNTYCPQKLFSLYLMLFCTVVMLIAAVFPNMKIIKERKD